MGKNWSDDIPEQARVLIDTNPLIYFLEGHARAEQFAPFFQALDQGLFSAVVTPITLAEIVSGPLKAGKEALALRYRQLLTANRGWTLAVLDADCAMMAARLRGRYRLKLPDAFQLAAAIQHNCYAVITHDRDFSAVKELAIYGLN
jgi:predicted nucleic acid-binding protein